MENKELIISNVESASKENKLIVDTIQQFKYIQEQLKSYKELDKLIREELKKYDFQKIIIMNEKSGNTTFTATQYDQERKTLNKDKLIEVLEAYIKSDLGLGDDIFDKEIPLKQELERIVDESYEINTIKCIKYGVK